MINVEPVGLNDQLAGPSNSREGTMQQTILDSKATIENSSE